MTPTPTPVPTDLAIDPNRVTPGLFGFLAFVFLILAVVVLYFSMRKQLSKVNFEEDALPAGVKPLPKYATKEERRKTALRLQKEREAAVEAGKPPVAQTPEPPAAPSQSPPPVPPQTSA